MYSCYLSKKKLRVFLHSPGCNAQAVKPGWTSSVSVKQPYALSVDFRPPEGMLCLYPLRQQFTSCLHYCRAGIQYFLVPSTGGCCVLPSIPAKHSTSNLTVNISNFLLRPKNQTDFVASVLNPVSFFPKGFTFLKPTCIFKAGHFMRLLMGTSTATWLVVTSTSFPPCPK